MIFFMILIVLGVLAVIGYPLVRQRMRKDLILDDTQDYASRLMKTKEPSYAAIKELDFDYHTGKLSDEDYEALYQAYKSEALQTIKALDEKKSTEMGQLDAEIEAEINKKRRCLQKSPDARAKLAGNICPACGAKYTEGTVFCGACGTRLGIECSACGSLNTSSAKFCHNCGERLQKRCPQCGHIYETGAIYCSQCGAALTTKGGNENEAGS